MTAEKADKKAIVSCFGCCHLYNHCSFVLQCVSSDPTAQGCQYREHLERGRVFYGKHKNIAIAEGHKFKIGELNFHAVLAINDTEKGGSKKRYSVIYYLLIDGKEKPVLVLKTNKKIERKAIIGALIKRLN